MIDFHLIGTLFVCLCLALIIFFDFAYFQIPNLIVGAILVVLFAIQPKLSPHQYTIPAIILVGGFALSCINIVGFGDSKLLASLSLGLGDTNTIYLLVNSVFLGGVLGIIFLLGRKQINKLRKSITHRQKITSWSSYFVQNISDTQKDIENGVYDRYIPYGIPISLVGIFLLLSQ